MVSTELPLTLECLFLKFIDQGDGKTSPSLLRNLSDGPADAQPTPSSITLIPSAPLANDRAGYMCEREEPVVHCVRYMALLTVLLSERRGAGEGAVRKAGMEGVFGERTEGRDEKRSERTNRSNSIFFLLKIEA